VAATFPRPDPSLKLEFCGLTLASPIVLLSGCVGFGEEYTRVEGFSNAAAGAIVLKGTTREPRLGNPAHRVYETPMGMLNAIGLQNPGVDHVVRKILPTLDFSETRFIANVCGSTIEDYVEVTRRFDDSPIDAIEINISCPNIKEGGVQFGNYPEMSARVVAACREVTRKPLITKLSPNQTDIRENARRCIEAGSDGLAVINTIMGMSIDAEEPVLVAIQIMAERHIGALPVLRAGELAGVISERDYARKVILLGRSSAETPVSQIMSAPVITVTPDETVQRCMEIMTEKRIRHLPVIDEGRMIGMISIGDCVRGVIEEQQDTIQQLERFISG